MSDPGETPTTSLDPGKSLSLEQGSDSLFVAGQNVWNRLEVLTKRMDRGTPGDLSSLETPSLPPVSGITTPASPAIELQGVTRRFGEHLAVDNLTFTVRKGDFFGFLGLNGAGKSTTIRILSGLLLPTSGKALVAGLDVTTSPHEVKRRIGILPEEVTTYERLSGFELLKFVGRIYGMTESAIEERSIDLFRVLDFTPEDSSKLIVDYSMGMKKKIALAAALIHNPEILFLDEPFNGIDAVTSRSIRLILKRAVESGVTVFFSSHILEVVERLCNRLGVIHNGRLVAYGTLDEIRQAHSVTHDTRLDDLFVRLVGGEDQAESLDWLKFGEESQGRI